MIVRSWFGTALLAVQFWDLYSICIEKIKTLAEVWVDGELRVTFRRTFSYSDAKMGGAGECGRAGGVV
jgi:hypothetical protein